MASDSPDTPVAPLMSGPVGPVTPLIPSQVGPYHLLHLVGEGGMGQVYQAEQRSPVRRIVALKVIKLGMDTTEVIARFERERQALALMNHPNVARVFDAGATDTGRPYFVMEYVAGIAITSYCDKHELPTRQRLALFRQACEAVQHAHQKAIIHRDLKPSNILVALLDGKPIVKVIDFGVAKATSTRLSERTLMTERGHLLGTPEYMSPEQAEMSGLDVDTRSDIYSLGVVLYELLSGALPFDPKTLRSVAYDEMQRFIREVDPPRPSARLSSLGGAASEVARCRGTRIDLLARELRDELEWIPLKAIRKDRTARYSTTAEFAEDIDNYLSNRPLIAGPESAVYRLKKFARRNRRSVLAGATLLLALTAGLIGTGGMYLRSERMRRLAEASSAQATLEAGKANAVSTFLRDMLTSADPASGGTDPAPPNPDVRVRDVLEQATSRLDAGSLQEQPAIEAAVRLSVGSTFRSLGLLPAAEQQLRAALALHRRSTGGLENLTTAQHLDDLARVVFERGSPRDAAVLLSDATEIRKRLLGPRHRAVGSATADLGLLVSATGDYARAETLMREGIQTYKSAIGEGTEDTTLAQMLSNLAELLWHSARAQEAEPIARQALAIQRKLHGEAHPAVANATGALAMQLYGQGKPAEAEKLFRQALASWRSIYGDRADHPRIATMLTNVGAALRDQGKLEDAETVLRESLDMQRRVRGEERPGFASSLSTLGLVLHLQQEYGEAETLLRQSVDLRRRLQRPGHPEIGFALVNHGRVLIDAGEPERAETLLREASQILVSGLAKSPQEWRPAWTNFLLGVALARQRKFEQAASLMLENYSELEGRASVPAAKRNEMRGLIAQMYDEWGRPDEARKWRAEAPTTTGRGS